MTDLIVSCKEFCMRQVRVSGRRYAMYGGCKDGNLLIASDITSAAALSLPFLFTAVLYHRSRAVLIEAYYVQALRSALHGAEGVHV